jgi:hypothetical protein
LFQWRHRESLRSSFERTVVTEGDGVVWLIGLPIILIGSAALASFAFVRLSSLRITNAGVEIRNYPQALQVIPLEQAERFLATERVGIFASLRPETAALLLADGSRVPVRVLGTPDGIYGVDALNRRLAALRPGT